MHLVNLSPTKDINVLFPNKIEYNKLVIIIIVVTQASNSKLISIHR